MTLHDFIGLRLEQFKFSKSGYFLTFGGESQGETKTFEIFTPFSFAVDNDFQPDNPSQCSARVWDFLEKEVIFVHSNIVGERHCITFDFKYGKSLTFFNEDVLDSDLLFSKDLGSDDWGCFDGD